MRNRISPLTLFLCGSVVIIGAGGLVGACAKREADQAQAQQVADPNPTPITEVARVLVDTQTGCQYYEMYGHALTPRLGSDGQPMCNNSGAS